MKLAHRAAEGGINKSLGKIMTDLARVNFGQGHKNDLTPVGRDTITEVSFSVPLSSFKMHPSA